MSFVEKIKEVKPIYVIFPVVLLIVLIGGTLGIVNYQKNNKAPFLEIESPVSDSVVKTDSVSVRGKTVPGSKVTVNDMELTADENGEFMINVFVVPGENKINIVSENENGKQTLQEITINYQKAVAKKKATRQINDVYGSNTRYVTGKGQLLKTGPESLYLGEISIFSGAAVLWAGTRKKFQKAQRKI